VVAEIVFDERVAASYDADSAAMYDPAVVDPAVDFLAGLAGDGTALELGVGTGRVALPLSRRGVRIRGIDVSQAMVDRLREKPGSDAVDVTIGDFATTAVDDLTTQTLVSHHHWITDRGREVFSSRHRYVWPSELDLMARIAGMTLRERWADWHRAPFTGESTSHVSVWDKD
jgi:SAM-dependent methyltransferase